MKLACLLIVVALTGARMLHAEEIPAIAVMDLDVPGLASSEAAGLSNRLRSELVNTGKFTVLERSKMNDILKEQGFQQTGCTNTDCAVEMGQLLNVKYMVLGSVDIVGHIYSVNIRLVSVSTARIEDNKTADCSQCTIDDVMLKTIGIAARKIAGTATAADTATPADVQPRKNFATRSTTQSVPRTESAAEAEPSSESESSSGNERAIRPTNSVEPPQYVGRRTVVTTRKQAAEPVTREQIIADRKLKERKTMSAMVGMSFLQSNTFQWWAKDSFNLKYTGIKWGPGLHAGLAVSPIRSYSNPNSHSFFAGCDIGANYDQNTTLPSTVKLFDSLHSVYSNASFTTKSMALRRISIFDNIILGYSSNAKPVAFEPYAGIGGAFDFALLSGSIVNNKTYLTPTLRFAVPLGARIYIRKFFVGLEYDIFFSNIVLDKNLDYDPATQKSIDGTMSFDHLSYWMFSIGGIL